MENKVSKIEELKDQVVFLIEGLEEDFKQYSEMRDEEQTDFIAEAIDSLRDVEEGLQNAWSSLVALE
ncbi:MAG: hypothetical protein ACLFUT_01220 [Desulfobacteraceae bacterium]